MKLWKKIRTFAVICGCIIVLYFGTRVGTVPLKRETPHITFTSRTTHLEAVGIPAVLSKKEAQLITLFTSFSAYPKAFDVYNNTLRNWPSLQPHVNTILFTNDNIPSEIKRLGWTVLPVKRQIKGHPVLKDMFIEVMKVQPNSKLYGFVNGDILFTDSLTNSLQEVVNSTLLVNKTYLVVGRRMDTPNVTREEASSWETITKAAKRGELMNERWGIDYFFTSPGYHWNDIPDVQIGIYFYDNWLVWDARRMGYEVIDVTNTLLAVHQNAPYPTHHLVDRDNNLNYFKESRATLYNKGVVPCCNYQTVNFNRTIALQRRKHIPKYCTM